MADQVKAWGSMLHAFISLVPMHEMNPWLQFTLGVLSTWRLTHLLAREDGPADSLVYLRQWLGTDFWGSLIDCFYCLSLWVAAPVALVLYRQPLIIFLAWLALSGAACLLERLSQEPVIITPMKEGAQHGMLWSETHEQTEH